MLRRLLAAAAFPLFLAAVLPGCNGSDTTSSNDSTESASSSLGTLRDAGGHPVEGAEIRIFPVEYLPQASDALAKTAGGSQAYRARTDAEGHYPLPALTPGLYNILATGEGEVVLRDSIFLPSRGSLEDTLRAPASLSGRVGLQPGEDPRGFAVQVVGLPYLAHPDTGGRFSLTGLPAGHLRLRIARIETSGSPGTWGYLEGSVDVTLSQGRAKALEEPLAPVYLGVPAVQEVKAVMDTATGVATLSWSRPNSPLIDHYVVVREGYPLNPYNPYLITIEDTVFRDTLFRAGTLPFPMPSTGLPSDTIRPFRDTTVLKVRYRIAAAALNDAIGPVAGWFTLEAPAPWTVTTRFAFGADSLPFMVLPAGEKELLGVSFSNPTRKVVKLEWKDEEGHRLRVSEPGARQGLDTLAIEVPASGDSLRIRIEATDISGSVWRDSVVILGAPWKRLEDRPIPAYARAGRFQVDQPMAASGGKIYVIGSHGAQSHLAGNVFDPKTGVWSPIAEAPSLGTAAASGGKVYMAGPNALYAYSPSADAWDSVGILAKQSNTYGARPIFTAGTRLAIGAWQGILGATPEYGSSYDPATGNMSLMPGYYGPFTLLFATSQRAYLDTRYSGLTSYTWESGSFQYLRSDTYGLSNSAPVQLEGKVYFVTASSLMPAYDEINGVNQTLPGPGFGSGAFYPYESDAKQLQAFAVGDRIIAFSMVRPGWIEVMSYRPGNDAWQREIPLPIPGNRFASAESEGTIYVLGYYQKGDPRAEEPPSFFAYPALP